MTMTAETIKEQILSTGNQMAASGLVTGTWGNISAQVPGEGLVVITPSGIPYNKMKKTDLVVVDRDGNIVDGERRPSTELKMHLSIYRARQDAQAIVHTHSMFACAMAVAGRALPPILEEVVQLAGGEVPVARYARAGSAGLAAAVVEALGNGNAVLLANHGLVGLGRDVAEAYQVCVVVEKAAGVYAWATLLGGARLIDPGEVQELRKLFLRDYGQPKR